MRETSHSAPNRSIQGVGWLTATDVAQQEFSGEGQFVRIDSIKNADPLALIWGIRLNNPQRLKSREMAGDRTIIRRQGPSYFSGRGAFRVQGQVAKDIRPQVRQIKEFNHLRNLPGRLRSGLHMVGHSPILSNNHDALVTVR